VRLLFQPSEEGADDEGKSGAARMVEDGAMDGVEAVFGLHVITDLPTGTVGVRAGAVQAAADLLQIEVRGRGCHAAQPHRGRDTILMAAQLISTMQSVVARAVDPLSAAVVSLGTIHGGTRANIIPDKVSITGSIRSLEEETRMRVHDELYRLTGVVEALGGSCDICIKRGYPVTVNDEGLATLVRDVARELLGADCVKESPPTMGAEDFSLLAREARGCFFRLGATAPGDEPTRGHSSTFQIDESSLPIGAALLACCALQYTSCATG